MPSLKLINVRKYLIERENKCFWLKKDENTYLNNQIFKLQKLYEISKLN